MNGFQFPQLNDSELAEVREELSQYRGLLKHPGWKRLSEYIVEKVADLDAGFRSRRLKSLEEALGQEYDKGHAAGEVAVIAFVEERIEHLDAVVKSQNVEE